MLAEFGFSYDDNLESFTRSQLNNVLKDVGKSDVTNLAGFVGMKFRGASAHGEYHCRWIDPVKGKQDDVDSWGYCVQGGYFVWRDVFDVAGCFELFDPDTDTGSDRRREYGGAVNCFLNGHRNKIQADFFRITQDKKSGDEDDNRLRVWYTLAS